MSTEPTELAPSDTSKVPPGLALPPPSADDAESAPKLEVGSEVKFDELGPLVVNSDGTLSRIANWSNMTPPERERIFRVLTARNKIRLADQKAKLEAADV